MNRRRFFGSLGLSALALPTLHNLGLRKARAQASPPKRFLVWFTPNGVNKADWFPTGSEHAWTLSPALQPLADFQDRMVVFGSPHFDPNEPDRNARQRTGISMKCIPGDEPSAGHTVAMHLTGSHREHFDGVEWASAPSVDQLIAGVIGTDTRFRSLELGVRIGGRVNHSMRMNYAGPGMPIPAENSPLAFWDRVFAPFATDDPQAAERALARRRQVSDFLHARFGTLRGRLDGADRARLDQHLALLRSHEERLRELPAAACMPPDRPDAIPPGGWDNYDNFSQVFDAQIDNLVMSFACDLSRVATLQITEGSSNARYNFLNGPDGAPITEWHHTLSHEPSGNADAMAKLTTISRWHYGKLAQLLRGLDGLVESDGTTVLDNTLILCINELSDGQFHTHQNMPWMLIGGAGLRAGRYLKLEDEAHNNLLLAIAQHFGVEADHIGRPEYTERPLPGLFS